MEPLNDEADLLAVLRGLVQQIEIGEYRDELGHRLKMNAAYLEAKALLELKGGLAPKT